MLSAETLAKKGAGYNNHNGSTMNRMLCRAENEMLQMCVGIFKSAGRYLGALVFDRFMSYKKTAGESSHAIRAIIDACEG